MKKILLKLSEENYRTLKWIAGKLDINISECLRSLIPNIQPPEPNIIKEQDILFAKYDDLESSRNADLVKNIRLNN